MAAECAIGAIVPQYFHMALMGGRAAQVPVTMDRPLKRLEFEAQRALQTGMGVLRDSKGCTPGSRRSGSDIGR